MENSLRAAVVGRKNSPVHFHIVKNLQIMQEIENLATKESPEENLDYLAVVPYYLVVSSKQLQNADLFFKNLNLEIGTILGSLLVALHMAGIWCQVHNIKQPVGLKKLLELPEELTPILLFGLGYPKPGCVVTDVPLPRLQLHATSLL